MGKTLLVAMLVGLVSGSGLLAKEKEIRKGRGRGEGEIRVASGGGGSRSRANKVEGLVIAVNVATGQVAIRMRNGVVVVVVATAATKIERNDLHVSLSAIRTGDRGQALFANNFIATKIESTGP